MFRNFLIAGSAAWLGVALVVAQEPQTPGTEPKTGETTGPNRFWQAKVGEGHFMVALDHIVSVSRHQYLLDGSVVVDEVTIDTDGQALARFYFIKPVTDGMPENTVENVTERAKELVDQVAERVGTDAHERVVKKYPDTTHAKSLEYRIHSEKDLTALYTSVRTAWESGRGRQFNLK